MKDKLLLSGVKLPANKLGSVADWLDIEQKDVIVSTEGLSNLQKFLECNPRKLSELVKGPKLVSNLMKIISAFTGRSSKQSILLAVSHESSKRHKIEFSTFEKALELMEDLLVGIKNPLNLVKNIPMDQFSDFVQNLGGYVPRDILISTQELAMSILLRMAWACSKDRQFQENYDELLKSMPAPFAECCKDEILGGRQAMEHMRALLNTVNMHNPNIKSVEFHELIYDGGNNPKLQGNGAIDICRNALCLTILDNPEAEGVKIPISQIARLHFVDDGKGTKDSKSIDLVLNSIPESLKKLMGLELPMQHSQGVLSISLRSDADMITLEECAKRGLAFKEERNTQEMNRRLQKEVDTKRRKTSYATTRSSSVAGSEASQVTPSNAKASAKSGVQAERRFDEALSHRPDQEQEKRRQTSQANSVSPTSTSATSPARRSARLEIKVDLSQSATWERDVEKGRREPIAADANIQQKVLNEIDTDDFEPPEEPIRKAAKRSPTKASTKAIKEKAKPKSKRGIAAMGQPSRSESVSTHIVQSAHSPARMRSTPVVEALMEPIPGPLSFVEADASMKQADGVEQENAISIGRKRLKSTERQQDVEEYDFGPFTQPDIASRPSGEKSLLSEGRDRVARAAGSAYARMGGASSLTSEIGTEREISYATRTRGRRILRDQISVKKMSADLFTSSEERDEGESTTPEVIDHTTRAQKYPRASTQRQVPRPESELESKRVMDMHASDDEASHEFGESVVDGHGEDSDEDEDEGTSVASLGGDALEKLAKQVREDAIKQTRAKLNRMIVAQADAAIEQVHAYLQAWTMNRAQTHSHAESEENVIATSFAANANAKCEEMRREGTLLAKRAADLSKDLQEQLDERDQLKKELDDYERMCVEVEEAFKEDVKSRYEQVARSLRKGIEEEYKMTREAKKRQKQLQQALQEA